MRFGIACLTTAALLLGGCATVDMTDMAASMPAKAEAPAERNIVLRAADKLYAAFATKGFIAKTSRKRMQSAASILLNGLEERDITSTDIDYAAQGLPRSVVIADITYATDLVSQTTKAAEVYFEISETDRNMRDELVSLEAALLSSREASMAFEKAIGADADEWNTLNAEIKGLTSVTDKFGERVRNSAAAEMAARRNTTS